MATTSRRSAPSFLASNRRPPIPSHGSRATTARPLPGFTWSTLDTWVQWSHAHGFIARNQSHGAPANLLDLYGDVDVPETELFGSTPFPIPGLRRLDDEVRHDQDLPDSLVIRMASSAAHVMGRRLTSSESSTWLRDNWKVALSYAKPELDRVMLDGINHVFYHGTVYSPQDAPWPGWLFYAATQYNPANPLWDDFGAMNRYVERVQSVLQSGSPDNDILLYWPVFDVWDSPDGMTQQLGVHDVKWLTDTSTGRLARSLMAKGYGFDYISDTQLAQTKTIEGALATPGGRYKILVVPASRRMPLGTLEEMIRLARSGATVVFESMPEDVPGYGHLAERRTRFRALLDSIPFNKDGAGDRTQGGKGRILRGDVTGDAARPPCCSGGDRGHRRRVHPPRECRWPRLFFCQPDRCGDRTVGDARDRRDFGNSPRSTHRERRPRRIATYRQSDRDLSPARPGRVARASDTP